MKHNSALVALLAGLAASLWASMAWAAATAPVEVPEPATLAVLAAGVGALAWVKFRGRR